MSETNAQEPTMEEILASIRRIISEDDPPADAAAAAPAAAAPAAPATAAPAPSPVEAAETRAPKAKAPAAAPTPPPEPVTTPHEEDVLELTDPVEPAPAAHSFQETVGDLDVFSSAPAAQGFSPAASYPAEPLTGSYASETSAGHFGALARSMSMPKDGRTLEDVVRELLKPLLRDWLDQHLSGIVEARVQAEVERIARRNEY